MLISKVTDDTESARGEETQAAARRARDYQTASELFDMMTKSQHFDGNVDDSLTTQDLVLLYKNLDLGTRLMSDANEVRRRKPNQRVETVVYDEPESDSDTGENYSKDDIPHIYNINQERINLLDNGSFDNLLCHKLGGLQIQSSEIITDGTQFVFRDPFIKEQLQSLTAMASGYEIQSLLPTSLLDYVCCKRIKDNYNFYMDNIIKYVQQTIDQLKRISNGDYLTDCAKEKWKKANKMNLAQKNTQVLPTSTSLRSAVECNETVTWHDVVHSEIDVRSLSKVLEKKIVLEIPKLICGSYKLFSKHYAESFIITFKREKQTQATEKYQSRLDVVLKLRRLQTGQVTGNVDSVTILKASPAGHDLCIHENLPIAPQPSINTVIVRDLKHDEVSTIEYKKAEDLAEPEPDTKAVIDEIVTEIFGLHVSTGMLGDNVSTERHETMSQDNVSTETVRDDVSTEVSRHTSLRTEISFCDIENETNDNDKIAYSLEVQPSSYCSCESSAPFDFRNVMVAKTDNFQVYNEPTYNLVSPDELRATMQRLSMQKAVPEEISEETSSPVSIKKKSPVRVRIKSPYENKSHILEEKKRNKLLEIRERRVKKKIALGENAKVCKHRYGKGGVVPQTSVTKLSISNKSFYNSIYGHNMEDGKQRSQAHPKSHGSSSPSIDVAIEQVQSDKNKSPTRMPDRNYKKYVNRSYYLDDTETEIMYMSKIQEVQGAKISSPSMSSASTDFGKNLSILSELTGVDLRADDSVCGIKSFYDKISKNSGCCNKNSMEDLKRTLPGATICNDIENDESKGAPVSLECRKSIEKLYNLIRKLENASKTELDTSKNSHNASNIATSDAKAASTFQASESGTSLKHYVTSSNPSSFNFDKTNVETQRLKSKKDQTMPTVPKVIISSKFEKVELKRGRKKISPKRSGTKVALGNPLKGISQLLQEVDNVQKIRQTKFTAEPKPVRKPDVQCNDGRPVVIRHTLVKRRSRFDQYNMKDNDLEKKNITSKDKRTKPLTPTEISRIPQQQIPVDDRSKKKMADFIEEAKEARGEAVRGPSKLNSRIMTLAQPKRTYVQAHSEEYQTKYGRNLMADRLQRLAGTLPPPSPPEYTHRNLASPKTRTRREAISNVSVKQPTLPVQVQPIDNSRETCRSANSIPQTMPGSLKAPEPPENVKKMVAVESYVRSHYGRFRHTETTLQDQITHKPRVLLPPCLPNDIDITNSSADELGKELHHIIDSIVTNSPVSYQASSATDDETTNFNVNPNSMLGKINSNTDDDFDSRRTDSDFDIGVLDDKSLKTAVESQGNGDKRDDTFDNDTVDNDTVDNDTFDNPQDQLQTSHSTSEIEQLESALYSQLSGAFQKRLRLKNLTLTPKQSLNHVFLLQAGDTKSLIVKSTVPNVSDLKAVSRLSPHLNWDFAQVPLQIATVGYAYPLPETETITNPELTPMRRLETSIPGFSAPDIHGYKSDKISQCFKGVHQETNIEQPAQVDVQDILKKAFGSKPTFTVSEFISSAVDSDSHEDNIKVDKFTITEKSSIHKQSMSVASTEATALAQDDVEYTTSLDILVGLLNEIQKITRPNPPEDLECRNLETMLRGAAAEVNNHREISMTPSLDKFDPNTGIYSYFISNSLRDNPKPPYLVDKEVGVDMFVQKELKNTFTDAPSIFPIVLSHGTNARNSIVKIFPKRSSQSLISLDDYRSMCSKVSYASNSSNIIELPVADPVEKKVKEVKKVDLNVKSYEKAPQQPKYKGNTRTVMSVVRTKRHHMTTADIDPSIKIKRDILVTVYSILVFTVFAALSIPDMALFGA